MFELAVVEHDGLRRTRALASETARGLFRRLRASGAGLSSSRAPAIVEIVLAAAIGVVALFLALALFAPTPAPPPERFPAPQPQARTGASETGEFANPFAAYSGSAEAPIVEEGPDLAETTLNLTLHGTWVDEKGGAAIIKTPDGEQKRFSVGETVWQNVTLDRVYRDQVVIITAGVRESLRLVNREAPPAEQRRAPSSGASPAQSAASSEGAPPALALGNAVRLIPQLGGGALRFTLQPGTDARQFAAMGLRPGDVLIAVDNRRIGPEIAAEAGRLRDLASRSSVSITIERDGVALPLELDLSSNEATDIDEN